MAIIFSKFLFSTYFLWFYINIISYIYIYIFSLSYSSYTCVIISKYIKISIGYYFSNWIYFSKFTSIKFTIIKFYFSTVLLFTISPSIATKFRLLFPEILAPILLMLFWAIIVVLLPLISASWLPNVLLLISFAST